MDDVAEVYPTSETVYFLTTDGRLYGSGHNNCGQMGTADTSDVHTPIRIGEGLGQIVFVTCSPYDVFFINSDGELYGTGGNSSGRFGNGSTEDVLSPIRVGEGLGTIVEASIVDRTLFVLNDQGDLYSAGTNNYGIVGNGKSSNQTSFYHLNDGFGAVSDFRISMHTTLFLTDTGELYGCGRNDYGQLGQGNTDSPVRSPVRIAPDLSIASIETTYAATYILTTDGDVYACGGNGSGQLGTGDTENVLAPTRIGADTGKTFKEICVAYKRTALLSVDGCLYVGGQNTGGQNGLGNTVNVPELQQVTGYGLIDKVYCSETSTYIVASDGRLYGAGKNTGGSLGIGANNEAVKTFTEVDVGDLDFFVCCSSGAFYTTVRESHIEAPERQYAVSGSPIEIRLQSTCPNPEYSVSSCTHGHAEVRDGMVAYLCPAVDSSCDELISVIATLGADSEDFTIEVTVVQALAFLNDPSSGFIQEVSS